VFRTSELAAANQVVTLARVTNESVVTRRVAGQFGSVRAL